MPPEFSRAELERHLRPLPNPARAAFALACAVRLFSSLSEQDQRRLAAMLDLPARWMEKVLQPNDPTWLEALRARAEQSIHDDLPYCEDDALAALSYAADTALTGKVISAVYAAERVVDCILEDNQLGAEGTDPLAQPGAERQAALYQKELTRQHRDLTDLLQAFAGADRAVVLRATLEPALMV
jgi:hypothetical protein